jgi:AcrR family transcriptional regulator
VERTDLRIIKTKKTIRDAFLNLREKNALEKIRVNKLCEMALVNKTTFYKHYQDIYALSGEIEDETIQAILDNFASINALFSDTDSFIRGLYGAFKSREGIIFTLFGGRMNVLVDKVERQLVRHYPALGASPEKEILLSFLIKGASSVFMEARFEEKTMLTTLSTVARQIIRQMETRE